MGKFWVRIGVFAFVLFTLKTAVESTEPNLFIDADLDESYKCALFTKTGLGCWGLDSATELKMRQKRDFVNPRRVVINESTICVLDDLGLECWWTYMKDDAPYPKDLTGIIDITASTGKNHGFVCVYRANGPYCWDTTSGEEAWYPFGILASQKALKSGRVISARGHTVCLAADRGLRCWEPMTPNSEVIYEDWKDIDTFTVGYENICRIVRGQAECRGDNRSNRSVVPPELTGAKMIAPGGQFTCGLFDQGVKCFGDNNMHQLEVPPIEGEVVKVVSGLYHSCVATRKDMVCWGMGDLGGVVPYPKVERPTFISVGSENACAETPQG